MIQDGHYQESRMDRTRHFLWTGAAAPLVVVVAVITASLRDPSVNLWQQSISLLSEGPRGDVERLGFVIGGLLTLAYATVLRRVWASQPSVARSQIAIGVGLLAAGIFIQQGIAPKYGVRVPSPWGALTIVGIVHVLASGVLYAALVLSARAVARALAFEHAGRRAIWYAALSAIAIVVLLPAFVAAAAVDGPSGLLERLAALVAVSWQFWLTYIVWRRREGSE